MGDEELTRLYGLVSQARRDVDAAAYRLGAHMTEEVRALMEGAGSCLARARALLDRAMHGD